MMSIAGSIVTGLVTYLVTKRLQKERHMDDVTSRLRDIETTIDGQSESQIVIGLTDVVEMHEGDIEELESRVESLENRVRKMEELKEKIDKTKKRCIERNKEKE